MNDPYGLQLKNAIIKQDNELMHSLITQVDYIPYRLAFDACDRCDKEALIDLQENHQVDLTIPMIIQPDDFVINIFRANISHDKILEFANYLIGSCIDPNHLCLEFYRSIVEGRHMMDMIAFVLDEHNMLNTIPTLLDCVYYAIINGDIEMFVGKILIELLITKGAKTGNELGLTHEHGDLLLDFIGENSYSYNYEYLKQRKQALHEELHMIIFHPDNIKSKL